MVNRNELKKALLAAGFEVYRTLPDRVVLADRVRDNLIMDSGVSAAAGESPSVRVVFRAQQSEFSGEDDEELFERARALASALRAAGYRETATDTVRIPDPGDKTRVLDVWFEVAFEKGVTSQETLLSELRHAMSLEKTATPLVRRR